MDGPRVVVASEVEKGREKGLGLEESTAVPI
jgi:hypothetical protein